MQIFFVSTPYRNTVKYEQLNAILFTKTMTILASIKINNT